MGREGDETTLKQGEGTDWTFQLLARIVMIMSRYSRVKEADGSMTVLILSVCELKSESSTLQQNSRC